MHTGDRKEHAPYEKQWKRLCAKKKVCVLEECKAWSSMLWICTNQCRVGSWVVYVAGGIFKDLGSYYTVKWCGPASEECKSQSSGVMLPRVGHSFIYTLPMFTHSGAPEHLLHLQRPNRNCGNYREKQDSSYTLQSRWGMAWAGVARLY